MEVADRKAVLRIMRRAFSVIQQLFFSFSKNVLVAELNGKIQGAIVLKSFPLSDGVQGGVVKWVFTDPEVRGLGAGQQLIDSGLAWLEAAGCSQIFAIVEGFNTSSSKLFATRGFSILPFREQLRRFGLIGVARVWSASFHILDIGHFLWGKPDTETSDKPTPQLVTTFVLNALIAALAVWRAWDFHKPDPIALLTLPLTFLILIGLRTLAMMLVARAMKLDLRFRMWESGFNFCALIALAFGAFFPIPGGLYPNKNTWRYRELIPLYGRIALAGSSPALIVSWAAFLLLRFTSLTAWAAAVLSSVLEAAILFAIFDIVLFFFPFVSFNSRRLWDWHKGVWALLTFAVVALIVLMRIF